MRHLLYCMVMALLILNSTRISGQTCCTGGVPLTGAINLDANSGSIRFGFTYDINQLSDFIQGDRTLENTFLKRETHSVIGQLDLRITDSLSVSVLIPYSRLTERNTLTGEAFKANGLSDISIWTSYLLYNLGQTTLSLSAGIKLPTGATNIKGDQGIFDLPLSLQPGTGSVDFMIASAVKSAFRSRPSLIYSFSGIYKINTTGRRYAAHSEYKYSNELDLYAGLSEEMLFLNQLITPQLQLRINHFGEHQISGNPNPNTGGTWIFLGSGFAWSLSPQLSINLRGQWPLSRKVEGFQLTTTNRYLISAFFSLSKP